MQTWEEDSEEGEAGDLVRENVTECVRPLQLCDHHWREGMMSWRQLICHQDCNWTCFDWQTYGHSQCLQCRNILIKLAFRVCPPRWLAFYGALFLSGPMRGAGPPSDRIRNHGNSRNAFLRLDNFIYFCCPGSHPGPHAASIFTSFEWPVPNMENFICKP